MKPDHPKPLLVFVHPGSLCGSYQTAHDWHPKWSAYAETRRKQLCTEFAFLDAHKVAVFGMELDDDISQYPAVQNAVSRAERRYKAGPQDNELRTVARRIWKEHSHNAHSIRVTGAMAMTRAAGQRCPEPSNGAPLETSTLYRNRLVHGRRCSDP